MHELEPVFNPRSIAVIGASRREGSIGYQVLKNLIDGKFPGPIYPINTGADQILGVKVYPSIGDVPAPVDAAVYCVPADKVLTWPASARRRGLRGISSSPADLPIPGCGCASPRTARSASSESPTRFRTCSPGPAAQLDRDPRAATGHPCASALERSGQLRLARLVRDLYGGGGLVATPLDLARFTRALLRDEVFENPDSLQTMRTPGREDSWNGYGAGLFTLVVDGEPLLGHSGFWNSFAFASLEQGVVYAGATVEKTGAPYLELLRLLQRAHRTCKR